jgi:hypothetical protein
MIAQLAFEYKISPNELLSLEPRMLWTLQRYLIARINQQNKSR